MDHTEHILVEFFLSVLWLLVTLGILVTFHEFGHFWVARRCGVKVLRFSVGFGSPLLSKFGKDGTEYALAAIPLGGYVKMLDEREGHVPEHLKDQAFNNKSLAQRTAIVAAGPIFNLILAVLFFWAMFVWGIPEYRAMAGQTTGIAAEAGLQEGDIITKVGDVETTTLTHAGIELLGYAIDREPVSITINESGGTSRRATLALDRLPPDFDEEKLFDAIGFEFWIPRAEPVIGEVSDNSPAAKTGLAANDRILEINGQPIAHFSAIGPIIQEQMELHSEPLQVAVERDGNRLTFSMMPRWETEDGGADRWIVGIRPTGEMIDGDAELLQRGKTFLKFGYIEAVGMSFSEIYRFSTRTLGLLGRMVTGQASTKNLSGPITIARIANRSAQEGVSRYLSFLAILSLSLAILNFLPVPMLDGGHLLYFFIEWIKGKPVSEQAQITGQYIGLMAIAGLIGLVFYNDIVRLLS